MLLAQYLESHVVVDLFRKSVALHCRDPNTTHIEEPFPGQREWLVTAVVDLPRVQHARKNFSRLVEIAHDERDVT
jgi:hypothetical protein